MALTGHIFTQLPHSMQHSSSITAWGPATDMQYWAHTEVQAPLQAMQMDPSTFMSSH
jgi:hypothetical protein